MSHPARTSATIRCASCENGKFKETVVPETPDHSRIIDGYYFCEWCRTYTNPTTSLSTEEILLSRAQNNEIPRVFDVTEA